jgi:hypothetical protein
MFVSKRAALVGLVAALVSRSVAGCDNGDGDGTAKCVKGRSEACTCPNPTRVGSQSCGEDGTYGACVCDAIPDAAILDANAAGEVDAARDADCFPFCNQDADAEVQPDAATLQGDRCDPGPGASASPVIDVRLDGGVFTRTLRQQSLGGNGASYAQDLAFASTCFGTAGVDRTYLVRGLEAGQQLTASIASTGGFNGSVNIVPTTEDGLLTCAHPLACIIGAGTSGSASHLVTSPSGKPAVWLVVSSTGTPQGSFDLRLDVEPGVAGDGDSCATAKLQPSDGTFGNLTLDGFHNNFGDDTAQCTGFAGPDVAYRIQTPIPSGSGLRAKVTPQAGLDLTVTIVQGGVVACSGAAERCPRRANAGGPGVEETATYTNTSPTSQAAFVIVDSPNPMAAGTFTLQLTSIP